MFLPALAITRRFFNSTEKNIFVQKYPQQHKEKYFTIVSKNMLMLATTCNTTYRKYRESAHMSVVDHLTRQRSLDISPIWTPDIAAEVGKLHTTQLRPVYTMLENRTENVSV
jgi:hypothetical protein